MTVSSEKASAEPQPMLSLRVEHDLFEALRKLAKENHRTVSGEVRLALTRHLEQEA